MDRIALAKRLEGLSKVFASTTPYHRDLKAMAEVLTKVEDEKFATILSPDFTAEAADAVDAAYQRGQNFPGLSQSMGVARGVSGPEVGDEEFKKRFISQFGTAEQGIEWAIKNVPGFKKTVQLKPTKAPAGVPAVAPNLTPGTAPITAPAMHAEASTENTGMFWSKEASEAVQNNLVRDVVGMDKSICCDTKRHLDKGQVPDGSHDGEKAPTLKKEQTPDQSKSLDSGIVEKSHGKVNKEASEEPVACDDKAKKEEESKEAAAAAESAAAKAKKEKEEAAAKKKAEETAEAVKEMKKAKDATVAPVTEEKDATLEDSFELGDAMDEITLDAAEQDKLSQLFA